ncbi:MAG: PhoU domain-containing protein [Candidatus Lernaella stagnicola]|nr:PhoU domain-containing protein [Candidatus Lernaella stagnicola]
MLSKLLAGWKKDSLINVALGDAVAMLRKAELMFAAVSDLFLNGTEVTFDIYAMDKDINRGEIEVRRMVLEHLSISPRQDLVFSLVLTTIINDIERMGDYCKNIFELSSVYEPIGDRPPYSSILADATTQVRDSFRKSITAFESEDVEGANEVMRVHGRVNKICEQIMQDVAADESLNSKESVTLVLYARHLKRVSAHLANLMSSVVRPFDRIGFFRKQEGGAKKEETDIENI